MQITRDIDHMQHLAEKQGRAVRGIFSCSNIPHPDGHGISKLIQIQGARIEVRDFVGWPPARAALREAHQIRDETRARLDEARKAATLVNLHLAGEGSLGDVAVPLANRISALERELVAGL